MICCLLLALFWSTSPFGCVVAVLWPLSYHYKRHPVNYFLLAIFTVSLAFAVGLSCAFTSGKRFGSLQYIYLLKI